MSVPRSPLIVSSPPSPLIVSLPEFPERTFASAVAAERVGAGPADEVLEGDDRVGPGADGVLGGGRREGHGEGRGDSGVVERVAAAAAVEVVVPRALEDRVAAVPARRCRSRAAGKRSLRLAGERVVAAAPSIVSSPAAPDEVVGARAAR